MLRGGWPQTETTRPHTFSVPDPDAGTPSSDWRVLALEGGADGELIIGSLSPVPWVSSGVMGFLNSLDLDLLLFLSFFLAAAILALFNRNQAGPILFWGGCVAVLVVVNVVVLWLIRVPMLWAPDSFSYNIWPPFFSRMPSISAIYVSLLKMMSFDHLHALQINIMILSYLGALACVAFRMKRYWPFVPFTLFPLTWGNFIWHGSYVLSEVWFISGLLMGLSGLISIVMGGGQRPAVWSGAGLLLAVCAKPLGAIMVVPAMLAFRFIPGPSALRTKLLAFVVVPPIAAYLLMSIYGYSLSDRFAPHTFGGISLSGYVAWMLDPNDLPEEYREVGRETVAELQEVYSGLPPMSEPERFVDFTVDKINTAVYLILLPRFTRAVAMASSGLSSSDQSAMTANVPWWMASRHQMAMTNDVLGEWARNSIIRNPSRYVANCIFNYWGLWRDSFINYQTLGQWWRWRLYLQGYRLGDPEVQKGLPVEYNEYSKRWRHETEPHLIIGREFKLLSLRINEYHRYIAWALLIAALALSAMYLLPVRYSAVMAGMIMWALFVNAMFAGHVLFNTTLPRYGEPMVPLLPLLGAMTLVWLAQLLASVIQPWGHIGRALFWSGRPRRAR